MATSKLDLQPAHLHYVGPADDEQNKGRLERPAKAIATTLIGCSDKDIYKVSAEQMQVLATEGERTTAMSPDLEEPYSPGKIKAHMSNGEVKYLPTGEDSEHKSTSGVTTNLLQQEEDYSTIITIGGAPMLYIATNAKQFELMDELAKVAGKIGNIDYLINAIKRLPL